MSQDTTEEKSHEATPRKLQRSREKGQVARSEDVVVAAGTVAALAYLWFAADGMADAMSAMLTAPSALYDVPFDVALARLTEVVGRLALQVLLPLFALIVAVNLVASVLTTGGPVFSTEAVIPRAEKINPADGLKRLFGLRAWVTFALSLIKLVILMAILLVGLALALEPLVKAPSCGMDCVPGVTKAVLGPLVLGASAVMIAGALIDIVLQRWLFLREMRMTRTELKREIKEQEGDPMFRGQRRRIAQQMLEVRTGPEQATLVVSDGIRRAVAVRFVEGETPAPVVVAKGRGLRAGTLLATARGMHVPTLDDGELVERLARIEVGEYIVGDLAMDVVAAAMRGGG